MHIANSYSITSSYKMKLTGDLKALEISINIYRDAPMPDALFPLVVPCS